ncbi:MAG: DUF456 domain-containing protein [Candidatus Nanopelagicales bacterium]
MLVRAIAGIVGFFVVPIVGLVVGFLAGCSCGESGSTGHGQKKAWPTTMQAMKSAGWSVLIEFGSALLAAALQLGLIVLVL